jgi:C-terminal processing protease CtpA/Prc
MTTERLLTPAGVPLDDKGVAPDVLFEQTPASVGCRSLDIVGADDRCGPRSFADDGQLARALAVLDEPVVAAKDAVPWP